MSQDFESLKQTAKQLIQQSKWIDVQRILLKMHIIAPHNEQLLIKMADVAKQLNNLQNAKYYYQQALQINPFNSDTHNLLAMFFQHQMNNLSKAEQHYIFSTEINSTNDYAFFNLAKLYTKTGQYEKANNAFIKCLGIDTNKAAIHYHYGLLLLKMESFNHHIAYKHFMKAISIKPNIANYQFKFAKLSTNLGHVKRANMGFDKALKLSKYMEPKFVLEYATFCADSQKYRKGLFCIEKALEVQPNNAEYINIYKKIQNLFISSKTYPSSNDKVEEKAFEIMRCTDKSSEYTVFGFIHEMEEEKILNEWNNIIPPLVYRLCLSFYYEWGQWSRAIKSRHLVISSDGLIVRNIADCNQWQIVVSQIIFSSGKHSFEIEIGDQVKTMYIIFGVVSDQFDVTRIPWGYMDNGSKCYPKTVYGEYYGSYDRIKCIVDFDKRTIEFFKNGKSQGIAFDNLCGAVRPALSLSGKGVDVRICSVH